MNEPKDIKLKSLLHELELESPKTNFSVRVMNKIFEESNVLEKIKSERVLGKGFWIISLLFAALLIAVFFFSNSGAENTNIISGLSPQINEASNGYNSLLGKIEALPLGVAGLLAAFSILLFIDRFISSHHKKIA